MADSSGVNVTVPKVRQQPVSVTRKMAASLPHLRAIAEQNGLKIHHLGAGYPHPEVTDPRHFIEHEQAFFEHLKSREGGNDPEVLPEFLRESYVYTDTLGPRSPRESFAAVYGADWGVAIDPDALIPTVGATGGISLTCALFERPGAPVAYITDAPTYAGFLARASLCQYARIYSVDMDDQGPNVDQFRDQIAKARADGYFVPFYYTIPDGHNPAGFSFSAARREAILEIARDEGVLIVEDAPYVYISYADAESRPKPFFTLDPKQTIHLFTGSKIGFPGPRIGFIYTEAVAEIENGVEVPLTELLLAEAAGDILFQNPQALHSFESLFFDDSMQRRASLWPIAEEKLRVYRENREIMMRGFDKRLGRHPDHFHWTQPEAGFFTVFRFLDDHVTTDDAFVDKLVAEHGVVVIPMYDFYPADAKQRDPRAGLNELRLSFCFSEHIGAARVADLTEAVEAFCHAALIEAGLS
ncbi:MAG: PLP-dependent aminotransferase family protein [Gammaproteobacteria bacterium]|nr:PLP-dependent aminotransferase family protein [Gammaproteobacteria bacterium]